MSNGSPAKGPIPQPTRSDGREQSMARVVRRRRGPVPRPPKWVTLGARGHAWWNDAWKQPISGLWEKADYSAVARRAELEDLFGEAPSAACAAQMQSLDDRLGLNPTARMRMRVKYANDEPADKGEAKPGNVVKLVV